MNNEIFGHMKPGGLNNGLPGMLGSIALTKTSKLEGYENFEVVKDNLSEVKVSLPWVFNPKRNFKVAMISFVVVNGYYKYRAELSEKGDLIYLIPYQPYFGKTNKLPVIKLEAAQYQNALDLKSRAIANFFIDGKLYDFKTESKFTIENFEEEFNALSGMHGEILAQCQLTLHYKTKLFKTKDSDQVSYISMQSISPYEIISQAQTVVPKVIASLKGIEKKRIEQEAAELKNALTLQEAATILGSITIDLDTVANNAFETDILTKVEAQTKIIAKKAEVQAEAVKTEQFLEQQSDQIDDFIKNGININIAKALIKKFKDDAIVKAREQNFDLAELIKMLR